MNYKYLYELFVCDFSQLKWIATVGWFWKCTQCRIIAKFSTSNCRGMTIVREFNVRESNFSEYK